MASTVNVFNSNNIEKNYSQVATLQFADMRFILLKTKIFFFSTQLPLFLMHFFRRRTTACNAVLVELFLSCGNPFFDYVYDGIVVNKMLSL